MVMPAANSDSVTTAWYSARQLGQRQAQRAAHEPHAGDRPLHRNGIRFDEQVAMQGHEALIDLRCAGAIATQGRGHHVGHGARRDVRGHGDDAGGAEHRWRRARSDRRRESTLKSAPQLATSSRTRAGSPTASLMPTMRGTRDSRATVAGSMSTAVRLGTLYSRTGMREFAAIAAKCRNNPSCVGRT